MFIPLTITIFSGALSPSCLEGQRYVSERLQQSTRKLMNLPGSLDGLTDQLKEILSDWQVDLPVPSFLFLSSTSPFSDFDATAVLCRLRVEEMEYVATVSYGEQQSTPRYYFYKTLLQAEARWLNLLLKDRISRMNSDHAARLLLCEVLEEVYCTGVAMDDACRRGVSSELCGQLKGALASLYLTLTIDFGYLLQPTDFMDYRYLLNDARYFHPIRESEVQKYDILQVGNQVKCLLSAGITAEHECTAMQLYNKLVGLLAGLEQPPHSDARLWQGVAALENFLFFLLSGLPLHEKNLYGVLIDQAWMSECLNDLCFQQYAGHLHYNEGRGASHWIIRKQKERCLTFLNLLITHDMSLPRQLRSYLLRQQELYEENYSRAFISIQPSERLSFIPSRPLGAKLPDEGEIHAFLAFLYRVTDGNGAYLVTPEHVQWLEDAFLLFLQSGQIAMIHRNKVKVLRNYIGVLYGLFFHYQQRRGGWDKQAYAAFLASIFDVDVQPENLISNSKRYIETYEKFAEKEKLRLTS